MRLLKTTTGNEKLEVVQSWGTSIPPYAILSHTWSANPEHEVLLSDVQHGSYAHKPAYAKVEKAMERARLDGYDWLWIDTCCIDKTSSAELSEAINSMYRYYTNSSICYVYLPDVNSDEPGEEFKKSRWWGRGWTLQELLAPGKVQFFNSRWRSIGHKDTLHEVVTSITGIAHEYLTKQQPIVQASVAKRMSWASFRQTTREEDIAYCLLGIFEVNMPMLYGEGTTRAFLRLQEEILKVNEDQTLFVWVKEGGSSETRDGYHGLLADSPKDFARTGDAIAYTDHGGHQYRPSSLTARGLSVVLPLDFKTSDTATAALQCTGPGIGYDGWLAVYLKRLPGSKGQYARFDCDKLTSAASLRTMQEVYVRQHFANFVTQTIYPFHLFRLRSLHYATDSGIKFKYKIVDFRRDESINRITTASTKLPKDWSMVPMVYHINKTAGSLTVALLIERSRDREAFVLMLGTDLNSAIGVSVCGQNALQSFARMQQAFSPQSPGKFVDLDHHRVLVRAEEHIQGERKVYFIDIVIRAASTPDDTAGVRAKLRDKIHLF